MIFRRFVERAPPLRSLFSARLPAFAPLNVAARAAVTLSIELPLFCKSNSVPPVAVVSKAVPVLLPLSSLSTPLATALLELVKP